MHSRNLDWPPVPFEVQDTDLATFKIGDRIVHCCARDQDCAFERRGFCGGLDGLSDEVHGRKAGALRESQNAVKWTLSGDIRVEIVQCLDVAGRAGRIKIGPGGGIHFGHGGQFWFAQSARRSSRKLQWDGNGISIGGHIAFFGYYDLPCYPFQPDAPGICKRRRHRLSARRGIGILCDEQDYVPGTIDQGTVPCTNSYSC